MWKSAVANKANIAKRVVGSRMTLPVTFNHSQFRQTRGKAR